MTVFEVTANAERLKRDYDSSGAEKKGEDRISELGHQANKTSMEIDQGNALEEQRKDGIENNEVIIVDEES